MSRWDGKSILRALRGPRPRFMTLVLAPAIPLLLWSVNRNSADDKDRVQLVVDISARQLVVQQGDEVVRRFSVAVGRPGYPTPKGTFRTGEIVWNPSWTPPPSPWARGKKPQPPGSPRNPMQGVKIYFRAPWYYIHGTNDPGSIGDAASSGCIRMNPSDAIAVAKSITESGGSVPLVIRA